MNKKTLFAIAPAILVFGALTGCKGGALPKYNLGWFTKVHFGGEAGEKMPWELAQKSTEIVFGFNKDYADTVKSLTIKADVGETANDKITAYYDDTDKAQKLYVLSEGEIVIGDNDTRYIPDPADPDSFWGMFDGCSNATSIKLDNIDTSNVTNMNSMFYNCYKLQSLDLSKFNTSKAVDMSDMFCGYDESMALTSINLSSFNTSNVTDMSGMFECCSKLQSLDLSKFNTSNVSNMSYMFQWCSELTTLDLSTFGTNNVTSFKYMFEGDGKLTTIYVSNSFIVSSSAKDQCMFQYCGELKGGKGTAFAEEHINKEYARIDNPPSQPGYFTEKK